MAISQAFLKRSRALWVKREREYKRKAEHAHQMHKRREQQLAALKKPKVAMPMKRITTDSWGWNSGHDGIDLICPPSEPVIAVIDADVVRASPSGWWGLGNPGGALGAKGDGIVILRSRVNAGPFRKGMNICYGHTENATVKVGDRVKAGQVIGNAGFANAWHVHWMINGRSDTKGVGDRDPRPFLDYLKENS